MQPIAKVFLAMMLIVFQPAFAEKENEMNLTSTSFDNESTIPKLYTCDGKDFSPNLSWSDIPQGTKSFALIASDPDARGGIFYHWLLYNIPPSTTSLPENMNKLPEGTLVGKNSWGKTQYNGPCPPKGAAHLYIFTLYALKNKLTIPNGADAPTILNAIQTQLISKTELSATFGR